jgi:eukaryotic-like serine/threonine-protein kinase
MIGETILHYLVLERMGAGGMGVVYRALDTRLGRHVALKFLPDAARMDEASRERLRAEAMAAARVDHPNVGVIHGIEDADDRPFIVMALYQGESLRSRIDRGSVSVTEAVDLAIQAARGLAVAHANGVVHRDVKPDNLFLSSQGMLKVLDFGLAKIDRMDGLTSAGTVIGTLEYMSPEQIRGQAVDHRTDIWALGIVLY